MSRFRFLIWILLLVAGFLAVMATLVTGTPPLAGAVGLGVVGIWIAWGCYTSWRFGIRRHVVAHLGRQWMVGEVLRHNVRTAERVNLQLALDWLQSQSGTPGPFGVQTGLDDEGEEMVSLGTHHQIVALIASNPEPVALMWERMPTSPEETMHCANNALYLLHIAGHPVCVLVQGRAQGKSRRASVQLLGQTQETARTALDELLRLAREQSVYRGHVISIQRPAGKGTDVVVEFHDLGKVERDAIVLPGDLLEVIDRNVLGFFRHAEALRRVGQTTRHGVLLYGPPGTGKTLVTRYIASVVGATVLLVTGKQYGQLKPTCQLARLLSPSLVILEDVDLIAGDRRRNPHATLLHELLDQMDGLGTTADIVFLLTTNRPEALEAALAGRPGRVDQAIYFPLPDLACRRKLFAQFAAGLSTCGLNLDGLLARTEGASPAFIKELFRRAALMAIERGAGGNPLPVRAEDFERALRELVETGGALTRNFLGFPAHPTAGGGAP